MNSNTPDDWQTLFDELPIDSAVDEHQSQSLKQQVLQAYDDRAETGGWTNRLSTTGLYVMTHKTTRWVAAAATLFLAAWLWLSAGTQPSFAVQKILDTFLNARNVRFVMSLTDETMPPYEAECLQAEPGKMLMELGGGETMIIDVELGKMINLNSETKTASVAHLDSFSDAQKEEFKEHGFTRLRTKILQAQKDPDLSIMPLGEKEIDGRKLIGFEFLDPTDAMTIWAAPDTYHPFLIEIKKTEVAPAMTISKFEFDVELDDAAFSVPAGYRSFFGKDGLDEKAAYEEKLNQERLVEQSLTESLSIFSEANGGRFFDELSGETTSAYIEAVGIDNYLGKGDQPASVFTRKTVKISLGVNYATSLPASARAHYAGKDVIRNQSDRPIFWYLQEENEAGQTWRVLAADLKFRDESSAPDVAGAVPIGLN